MNFVYFLWTVSFSSTWTGLVIKCKFEVCTYQQSVNNTVIGHIYSQIDATGGLNMRYMTEYILLCCLQTPDFIIIILSRVQNS